MGPRPVHFGPRPVHFGPSVSPLEPFAPGVAVFLTPISVEANKPTDGTIPLSSKKATTKGAGTLALFADEEERTEVEDENAELKPYLHCCLGCCYSLCRHIVSAALLSALL